MAVSGSNLALEFRGAFIRPVVAPKHCPETLLPPNKNSRQCSAYRAEVDVSVVALQPPFVVVHATPAGWYDLEMQSKAPSVHAYLGSLPVNRRAAISSVRDVLLK